MAIHKVHTLGRAPNSNFPLICVGGEINGVVILADLADQEYRQSNGKIPPHLSIICPRCKGNLAITSPKKTIRVDYPDRPERIVFPNGYVYFWDKLVSVQELLMCTHDGWGKSTCGLHFRISNNRVHKA